MSGGAKAAMATLNLLLIKAVHAAIGTRKTPGAVASVKKRFRAMIDVPLRFQWDLPKLYFLARAVVTVRLRASTGKALEEIIETAIFLDDDDDVLNFVDSAAARRKAK
jgi:hypothetical protein